MGENEMIEIKTPETSEKVVEMPIVKTAPKKGKRKDKRPLITIEPAPHLTGRLLHVEIGSGGVAFAIKGKKGKAEEFSLRGLDASGLPAAAALLAALVASKSKMRVEFSMTAEGGRTVNKIRAQS